MFDDPNKALKKLQEQLLAVEEPEEDIFAPPGAQSREPEEFFGEELPEIPELPEAPVNPDARRQNKISLLVALLLLEVALLFGVLAWWLLR